MPDAALTVEDPYLATVGARLFPCAGCRHPAVYFPDLRAHYHLAITVRDGRKERSWDSRCPVVLNGVGCPCPRAQEATRHRP